MSEHHGSATGRARQRSGRVGLIARLITVGAIGVLVVAGVAIVEPGEGARVLTAASGRW